MRPNLRSLRPSRFAVLENKRSFDSFGDSRQIGFAPEPQLDSIRWRREFTQEGGTLRDKEVVDLKDAYWDPGPGVGRLKAMTGHPQDSTYFKPIHLIFIRRVWEFKHDIAPSSSFGAS